MTREHLRRALAAERSQAQRSRMISVRFAPDDLLRLRGVAEREGLAPATLARVLILTGLDELEGGEEANE